MESLSEKTLYALEEQLARQKGILENRALLTKLPDGGAKVKANLEKIEAEIQRRRKEKSIKQTRMSSADISKMEWTLGAAQFTSNISSQTNVPCDSDDDEEEEDRLNPNPLKIIATSQISQRQLRLKPDFVNSNLSHSKDDKMDIDRFTARLVTTDLKKHEDGKFIPSKSVQSKVALGSSTSPSVSVAQPPSSNLVTSSPTEGNPKPKAKKYDEVLLQPTHQFETSKILSMEESIKIESEKLKRFEIQKAEVPKTAVKVYAYDKLKAQGLLGKYTVDMQVSRPIRTDAADDYFDEEEDDLTDDQITEEESEESSDDNDVNNVACKNQKTSKDLSNLVNKSLQLK